jgi:serine/threonine protein kinase
VEILRELGEGAYGKVFLGKWLSNFVAVKTYVKRGRIHEKSLDDFLKEVEMINNFRHPNIVLYMGMTVEFNRYSMITEYVEQGSLYDHLHTRRTELDDARILEIVEDVALGMNYLHAKSVLHCDLKSSNVLIGNDWKVKLCDFGLSQIKSKKSQTRAKCGTPQWMAPEILRGEKYDYYSDVYSFGVIIWEILSNEIPYRGMQVNHIVGTVGFDQDHELPNPARGSQFLIDLMRLCLSRECSRRPAFHEIIERIKSVRPRQELSPRQFKKKQ